MSYRAAIDEIRENYYVARWLDERVRSHLRHGEAGTWTTTALSEKRDRLNYVVSAQAKVLAAACGITVDEVMRDVRPW
jgi:hypothetical protein